MNSNIIEIYNIDLFLSKPLQTVPLELGKEEQIGYEFEKPDPLPYVNIRDPWHGWRGCLDTYNNLQGKNAKSQNNVAASGGEKSVRTAISGKFSVYSPALRYHVLAF